MQNIFTGAKPAIWISGKQTTFLFSGMEFHDFIMNSSHNKGECSNFVHLLKQTIEFEKKCNGSQNLSEYRTYSTEY